VNVGSLDLTDPQVPGVATIGDAGALGDLLGRVEEDLLDRGYLRYKPGTSLVAGLRLASGPAFAYAVSAEARPKLDKIIRRAPRGSLIWQSPADGLLIARPAADRDLPALANTPRRGWTTLAYKPQRRWVGRPDRMPTRQPGSVLRAYRRQDLVGVLDGWRLASRVGQRVPGTSVPRVLSTSLRHGTAVVSWLPGQPLDRLLATDTVTAAQLGEVGAGLAHVHGTLDRRDVREFAAVRVRAAESVVRELGAVLPEHAGWAGELVRRLAACAPQVRGAYPVHGDFSADQVVIGPDGSVGFADWDRAGWGDPAADLGSLCAAGLPGGVCVAVLEGYRTVRSLPVDIDWYVAAAEAARLTEPLRTCRSGWREEIAARLTALEGSLRALNPNSARAAARAELVEGSHDRSSLPEKLRS
jgi:hypothetical protein